MVILPKERFSGEVRRAIEEALIKRFQAEVLNYHLVLGEGDQARLHFHLSATPESVAGVESEDLAAEVREIIRSWADRVRSGLERVRPTDEARRLAERYAEAFSPEYHAATDPDVAVQDILKLEAMAADDRLVSISLSRDHEVEVDESVGPTTELKLYLRGERLILSDFMPILENVGLRVIAVTPYEISGEKAPAAIIYSFSVQDLAGAPLDVDGRGTLLAEAILAVRRGNVTSDSLNGLVLLTGLSWREVDVLRAYAAYAFQLGVVPSRLSLPTALLSHSSIARVIFDIFQAKFDNQGGSLETRKELVDDLTSLLTQLIKSVSLLADDRALQRMAALLSATVRTNYFRHGGRTPTFRSGGCRTYRSRSPHESSRTLPARGYSTRCGCDPREWRGFTSAGRPLLAEGYATVTAGMTSAPRSSIWSTHRWSRMRSSCRADRRGGSLPSGRWTTGRRWRTRLWSSTKP
jgi:glutamate dehydrogenase